MRGMRMTSWVAALLAGVTAAAQAQEAPELRGTVVSATTGEPVGGAWVALEREDWGTFSWNDGHYFLPEIPRGPRTYEVSALGYRPEVLTLDPAGAEVVVELTPDPEMLEGLEHFMEQLQRRRNRGGDLRVFDREDLAFNGHFDLRDYLRQRGIRRYRGVCLNERPEAIGVLEREGHQFYLAEVVGGYVRLYTEDFVEEAARERFELQREPSICSGPVDTD